GWAGWLKAGQPPPSWVADELARTLLAEKAIASIEQDGKLCAQTDVCALLSAEVGLPCPEPGASCAGPEFVRRRVEEWGLVEWQIEAARRVDDLERAERIIRLGRLGSRRALQFLSEQLEDASADVRLAVVRALGLLATPEAAQPLLALLCRPGLQVSIPSWQRALMNCCQMNPELLLPHLRELDGLPRTLLLRVFAEVATPEMVSLLSELAASQDAQVRAHVARALGRFPEGEALALLLVLARDPVWFVRVRAMRSLEQGSGWEAVRGLLRGLNDGHTSVRQAAGESLARRPLALDELFAEARSVLTPVGWRVLLGEVGRQGLFWMLAEQLASPADPVRKLAEDWLQAALASGAHKSLLDALGHPNPVVADAVADFLGRRGDAGLLAALEASQARAPAAQAERLLRVRRRLAESVAD
ncbi:MAG: HEAT repeat domain-containing protein, partial [Acidobacteria bacterium]|nr:HEAT repeat domain-containing protein [Acidobacteriota bacterium]